MRLHHWIITACLLLTCSTHSLLGESNNDSDSSSQVAATESENSKSTHDQAASCGQGHCKRQHGESGCKGNCKNSNKAKAEDTNSQTEPDPTDQPSIAAAEDDSANGSEEHVGGPPAFTEAIHALLTAHEKITREVTDIPNGIEAVTTSDDPVVAALIRKHVKEMSERLENGQPVRRWDPLFRELFVHYKKIQLEVIEVEGGVKVRETSDDPSVVLLIRQHAHKGVSEFVRDGFTRAQASSPLPDGYVVAVETDGAATEQSGMGHGHKPGMGQGPGRGQGRGMGWGRLRHQQQDTSPESEADESTPDTPAS